MMAEEQASECSTAPSDVTVISVTVSVLTPVQSHPLRQRLAGITVPRRSRTAVAVAVALAASGVIIATSLESSRTSGPGGARRALVQGPERAAVAAAFGYPVRCLTVTI